MSKDPAILFYTSDFLTGTVLMTHEQVGIYIRLICIMHQHGGEIDLDAFNSYIGTHEIVKTKFEFKGKKVFNKRLLEEMTRRSAFCESRRSNIKKRYLPTYVGTSVPHMETETENENETKALNAVKVVFNFEEVWQRYPKKDGRKEAQKHFQATVKTQQDFDDINKALDNYLRSERVFNGFIKNGSTFFNGWRDWIKYQEEVCPRCLGKGKYVSSTGYESICTCPRGNKARLGKQ